MVARFEFSTAGRIVFGSGVIAELPSIAAPYGRRVLLVTGSTGNRFRKVIADLNSAGIASALFPVREEPTVALVREGAAAFRASRCDAVIAIGGGSAIDAGKAIAGIAANPGDVLDYLEVIGKGKTFESEPFPFIAVPTTAGTGSEVTRNAVLGSPEHAVKASLRSPSLLARAAIIDPDLTLGLPPRITAATGLDALTQLIEPFVSHRANPVTDAFCRDGLHLAARCLSRAYSNGSDREARAGMSRASLYGGLALANAGLGVVHGFAAPIGGMFPAPHGAVCAALLPAGMHANIAALKEREPESAALARYTEIAGIVTNDPQAAAEAGADWVARLVHDLAIPRLRSHGIEARHIPELVEKAAAASSMKANPIVLSRVELTSILQRAW